MDPTTMDPTTQTLTYFLLAYLREAVEEAEGVDGVVQPDGEADRGGGGATQALDEHLAIVGR